MDNVLASLPLPAKQPKPRTKRRATRRPCDDDFRRVDRLLHSICHWFQKTHPGHAYDDLRAVANMAFVDARASFNPERGSKLSTWVYNRVRYALWSHTGKQTKDAAKCRDFSNLEDVTAAQQDAEGLPCGACAGPEMIPDRKRFDPQRFLGDLSGDAAVVVRRSWELAADAGHALAQIGEAIPAAVQMLTLGLSPDLAQRLVPDQLGELARVLPHGERSANKGLLARVLEELGWETSRFMRVVGEVREAL